ncbi:Hpt domain-containing protein, partial [Rubellimicrobium mesophilum]|uniref:Hpt domain-containing protein n=1 Tax=Rubellimicrobium mesophilum TaxID=1123067 RepID=UPI00056C15D8
MDEETLAIFQDEAESLVESLEAGLLALQERPDDRALIDQVFRDLHTLKGTGGMFGFTELAGFVHGFESAFEALRSGASLANPALVAVSLEAHDHIVALLAGGRPEGAERLLAELAAAVSGVPSEQPAERPTPVEATEAGPLVEGSDGGLIDFDEPVGPPVREAQAHPAEAPVVAG